MPNNSNKGFGSSANRQPTNNATANISSSQQNDTNSHAKNSLRIDRHAAIAQLVALGYQKGDRLNLRFFLPTRGDDAGRKLSAIFPNIPWLEADKSQAEGRGAYLVINSGGHTDKEINHCRAVFYEHDDLDKSLQIELWKSLNLPEPSLQVDTGGKSIHSYWTFSEPIAPEQWRQLQTDLLEFANADRKLKNPSRVMRLAGGWHSSGNQSRIILNSGKRYSFAELRSIVPQQKEAEQTELRRQGMRWHEFDQGFKLPIDDCVPLYECLSRANRDAIDRGTGEGGRSDIGFKLAANLIATADYLSAVGQRYEGSPESLMEQFASNCCPPLPDKESTAILQNAGRYSKGSTSLAPEEIEGCIKGWKWRQVKGQAVEESQSPVKTEAEVPQGGDRANGLKSFPEVALGAKHSTEYDAYRRDIASALAIQDSVEREFAISRIAPRYSLSKPTVERAIELITTPTPQESEAYFGLTKLLDEPSIGLSWIIDGMIPRGETILLSAKPKTGKTLLAYEAAKAVVTGTSFLGENAVEGNVLIIQCEEGKYTLRHRMMAFDMDAIEHPERLRFLTHFDVTKDIPRLEKILEDFRPTLVIMDSLRKISSRARYDENSSEFAKPVYVLSDLFRQYNASGIFIHHDRKSTGDDKTQGIDNIAGTSALAGATWGTWRLLKMSVKEDCPKRHLLTSVRGTIGARHALSLEEGEGNSFGWNYEGEVSGDPETRVWREKILLCLKFHLEQGISRLSVGDMREYFNLPYGDKTLNKPLNRMIERQMVSCEKDAQNKRLRWYSLPGAYEIGDKTPPSPPERTNSFTEQPETLTQREFNNGGQKVDNSVFEGGQVEDNQRSLTQESSASNGGQVSSSGQKSNLSTFCPPLLNTVAVGVPANSAQKVCTETEGGGAPWTESNGVVQFRKDARPKVRPLTDSVSHCWDKNQERIDRLSKIRWTKAPKSLAFLDNLFGVAVTDIRQAQDGSLFVRLDGYSELIPSIEVELAKAVRLSGDEEEF